MTSSIPGARLLAAAAISYAANCLLGTGVATSTINTTNARWVHHALCTTTSVLTASAVGAPILSRLPNSAPNQARAGWLLLPALVPLAVIPFLGSSTGKRRRHTVVALAAAPFYALAGASVLGTSAPSKPGSS